jgi:hypothetical protein
MTACKRTNRCYSFAMNNPLPKMLRVRQNFQRTPPLDIARTLETEFEKVRSRIKPGARVAVGVGSRGITNLPTIVANVIRILKQAGAQPFIIPAMGSHGGATPQGQRDVLSTYGITEAAMGAPIRDSLEVRQLGVTEEGVPAFCSVEALGADAVVLINRVKPHTDFIGTVGSGLVKMTVIGLGKRAGAAAMHGAASRLGFERIIRGIARMVMSAAPILCGVAIIEDQFHETVRLAVLPREEIESGEGPLLEQARKLMPLLPFEEMDLLIVDRIGKNISGSGMDPNVTGRWVQGYSSALARQGRPAPFIRRIFVRDLTPETHGNGIGIGLADATTTRLVRALDHGSTYTNALTSLSLQCAKIPISFDTDEEAIDKMLSTLALSDTRAARIVRIASTLSVTDMEVSEALLPEVKKLPGLVIESDPFEMEFDGSGNLREIEDTRNSSRQGVNC